MRSITLKIVVRKRDCAVTRSGKVIFKGKHTSDCRMFLEGYTGRTLDKTCMRVCIKPERFNARDLMKDPVVEDQHETSKLAQDSAADAQYDRLGRV
jgi:hypothetical protein